MAEVYKLAMVESNEKACVSTFTELVNKFDCGGTVAELAKANYEFLNAANLMFKVTVDLWKRWKLDETVYNRMYKLLCRLINMKELLISILASYERGDDVDPEDDLANIMDFVSKMLVPLSDWETSYWMVHFDKKMEDLCATPGQAHEEVMEGGDAVGVEPEDKLASIMDYIETA